jgi:hypothetical protein
MHSPDTSKSEISIDYQLTIKDEISTFQRRALKYRQALNDEAVWLFLATLGCWSVTHIGLQAIALLLTWIIFYKRWIAFSKDIKSFDEWVQIIKDRIAQSSLPEDSEKARRFELAEFQKDVMSLPSALKDGQVYFLCFLFYCLTFLNWGYRLYVLLHPLSKSAC